MNPLPRWIFDRAELQSQLLAIQEKLPRTIVLVTHQLEEALLLGRRIIVMHPDSTICEFDLTDLSYPGIWTIRRCGG